MDIEYCLICGKEINLNNEKEYRYDDEALIRCEACFHKGDECY